MVPSQNCTMKRRPLFFCFDVFVRKYIITKISYQLRKSNKKIILFIKK